MPAEKYADASDPMVDVARKDLSCPRPWRAVYSQQSRSWRVDDARGLLVACKLSERDAKDIAAASLEEDDVPY